MTNTELKRIAQAALKSEYGFQPTLKEITLREVSRDGTYVLFSVNGHGYEFCKSNLRKEEE